MRLHAGAFIRIVKASDEDDMTRNTDFEVIVEGGTIACRIRDASYFRYRDITIRNWLASGAKTEADKIIEGYGRWMFYGWAANTILRWVLISLDVVRQGQMIQQGRVSGQIRHNKDGITSFVVLPLEQLRQSGAIEASCNVWED